jgi:GT2 family glycosyltransferase
MVTQPLVFTVILNTNRREDTLACLESLHQNTYTHHQTVVLDNASTDGSVEAISARFAEVQIINLKNNLGYAGNNNVGIQAAVAQGADWVFVLNEDTILAEDCLAELVSNAARNPKIGIAGPMVYHYDEPEVIQSAGGRLGEFWDSEHIGQNEPDRGQFPSSREVDWISGCALLARREMIAGIGGLDERFFYYWEETEWCLRAASAGWEIWHIPSAKLWHKGVQRNYRPSPNVTYYSTRNRLLMLQKHHAPMKIKAHAWLQTWRTLLAWTVKPRWRDMRPHRDAMWQGMGDFLRQKWGMRSANN